MANLLDTHTVIWFLTGDSSLSSKAKNQIETEINYISIASIWEIAVKISLGKLVLNTPFQELASQLQQNHFSILPITFEDTLIVSTLPFHHRDPFDRIIIAQAITNKLQLITKDEHFNKYEIEIVW